MRIRTPLPPNSLPSFAKQFPVFQLYNHRQFLLGRLENKPGFAIFTTHDC